MRSQRSGGGARGAVPSGGRRRLPALFLTLGLALGLAGPAGAESGPFPRPAELEPDVRFWVRVFTEAGTDGGYIHDSRDLSLVYERVRFPHGWSQRARERHVEGRKRHIRGILERLAAGRRSGLSDEEQRVLALFPSGVGNGTLRTASRRLRFQLGQADKFRAGLVRSGAWERHIRETFTRMGLPVELAALPHVESSYNPAAYSRVGAAGMWQFTRSTGRRYLRIDGVVDERMDPFASTVAAARLLEHNRQVTGSWPLAITAYNHGASGMRRAVRKLGTRDIATIVRRYRSRTFGFASRNFYVEFLAAAEVDFHQERYFGSLTRNPEIDYEVVAAPSYLAVDSLVRALGIDVATLRQYNPALRPAVWRGSKYVPRGYELRLPRHPGGARLAMALDSIPADERLASQRIDRVYRVARGDTLSGIARRYGVSVRELQEANGLRSRHRIRVGQVLELPGRGAPTVAARNPAEPVPAPADGLHRVRRGQTLAVIARTYGARESDLVAWNGLRNRHRIYAGQVLRVVPPEPAATEPAPAVVVARADVEPRAAAPAAVPAPADAIADVPAEEVEAAIEAALEQVGQPESADAAAAADVADAVAEAAAEAAEAAEPSLVVARDDPTDYSVAEDGTIEVQAAETLGHFAEWLDIRASRLRHTNGLRYGDPVIVGRRIELDFARVDRDTFERRRLAYHRELQEEFFARYRIAGTEEHVVRRGESLWTLSQHAYRVPLWLLRQYNPDLDLASVAAGTRLTIPRLETRSG